MEKISIMEPGRERESEGEREEREGGSIGKISICERERKRE